MMKAALRLAGIALGILAAVIVTDSAYAVASPDVTINRGYGFRNVIDSSSGGDLAFLIRYELPNSVSDGVSDAWCQYLTNETGCDGTPANPTNESTLPNGYAFARLRASESGSVYSPLSLRRIGHGLAVVYLSNGHGLTFGDSTMVLCIQSADPFDIGGTTHFDPPASACTTVSWSAAASGQAAQQEDLGVKLLTVMREIEQARSQPSGTLVSNLSLITAAGQEFTRELIIPVERMAPEVFESGASPQITTDYATPTGKPALTNALATAAATATAPQQIQTVARQYAGVEGPTAATFGMILIGAAVATFVLAYTRNVLAASIGFMVTPLAGIFIGAPEAHVYIGVLFVVGIPFSIWLVGKVRT